MGGGQAGIGVGEGSVIVCRGVDGLHGRACIILRDAVHAYTVELTLGVELPNHLADGVLLRIHDRLWGRRRRCEDLWVSIEQALPATVVIHSASGVATPAPVPLQVVDVRLADVRLRPSWRRLICVAILSLVCLVGLLDLMRLKLHQGVV